MSLRFLQAARLEVPRAVRKWLADSSILTLMLKPRIPLPGTRESRLGPCWGVSALAPGLRSLGDRSSPARASQDGGSNHPVLSELVCLMAPILSAFIQALDKPQELPRAQRASPHVSARESLLLCSGALTVLANLEALHTVAQPGEEKVSVFTSPTPALPRINL